VQVTKPAQDISADAVIEADPAHPYVSRGGLKLAHGLEVFGIDPEGRCAWTSAPRPVALPKCFF
jgi:23S rRNA (cytidine1920-2'-O)/16S rRNA (cytidine1409-2'-O)-methyltransferase